MQKNKLVSIHTYFDIPFQYGKSRHHANKCSIADKYMYVSDIRKYFYSTKQYGHGTTIQTKMHDIFVELHKLQSYPEFRFFLDMTDASTAEYIILAALTSQGFNGKYFEWLFEFKKDNPKLLNLYAKDKDFCRLLDYIAEHDYYCVQYGIF